MMRHLIACWLIMLAVGPTWARPASAEPAAGAPAAPGELLVRLSPGASLGAVARAHGLAEPAAPAGLRELGQLHRLLIADGGSPEAKAAELAADPRVGHAEPNYLVQAPEARQRSSWAVGSPDGERYARQWAAERIRLPAAHAISRGAGVTVAVLDTGADLAHPALAGRVAFSYDVVDDDGDVAEEGAPGSALAYGHGTHVAGLVALAAPEAQILVLRTLGPDGVGTVWDQLRALDLAAAHGADVINLSWSFDRHSRLLADALADLSCARRMRAACREGAGGAAIAAAAGNSGLRSPEYPAAEPLPGLLAVGASGEDDRPASFSSSGPWVQIVAPGEQIVSSVPGGLYAAWSGTSMAAPLSAGTLALIRAAAPELSPAQAVVQLVSGGLALGAGGRRLDSAAALGLAAP